MKLPVIFALLTALFWGLYGPVLGLARAAEQNPFKPYLLIGVAYLVWAILGGAIGMKYTNVPFAFSGDGLKWGLISGSLGAFGALTLTLAMFKFPTGMKPRPEIVMPIVFGGAVTVTALTNLAMSRGQAGAHAPSPWLWVGIVGMAVCIVVVAYNTPHVAPKKPSGAAAASPPSAPAESKNA
jgi:hypothetical protein